MKNEKAITLVSLVVTIIVLIILAGISINLVLGDNGIVTRAKEAKKEQIIAEVKEKMAMEIAEIEMDAIEKNEEIKQEQLEEIIAKYGELQEDKDTIILKENNYTIKLSEINTSKTTTGGTGSNAENEAKIAALEQQVKELNAEIERLKALPQNSTIYQVSSGIVNIYDASSDGVILLPNIEQVEEFLDGRTVATVLSNKVTLVTDEKITLPKGSYTFESYVPIKEGHGVGYKVFDGSGNLIVDHTYEGAPDELSSTNFTLEDTTDLKVYWYRTNSGWTDFTYYAIKTN